MTYETCRSPVAQTLGVASEGNLVAHAVTEVLASLKGCMDTGVEGATG